MELETMMIWCVSVVLMCVTKTHSYFGETSYRYLPDSTLRVSSVELEPYLMPNPQYIYNSGQPQFIGYIPDLMHEISRITGLSYVITKAPDNAFGFFDGSQWDGMIGELVQDNADIAAGPMYVTSQRGQAVDFTVPFMEVEATLLLRKPLPGTSLQIRSISDLLDQSEIKYGTLDRGVLIRAFKNASSAATRIMWRNMKRFKPSVFTETNEEGIARVRNEKYAFVIPHTIGEYMSMQEPCDLVTVDRFLVKRGYSLGLRKEANLLYKINDALGILNRSGKLSELYRTWWIGRSKCNGSKTSKMYGDPQYAGASSAASSERVAASTHKHSVLILFVFTLTVYIQIFS